MPEMRAAIVGTPNYFGGYEKLIETPIGAAIELVRHPENEYDSNAIKCLIDGVMLGFVPKAQNAPIAAKMDAGDRVTATLLTHPEWIKNVTTGKSRLECARIGISWG